MRRVSEKHLRKRRSRFCDGQTDEQGGRLALSPCSSAWHLLPPRKILRPCHRPFHTAGYPLDQREPDLRRQPAENKRAGGQLGIQTYAYVPQISAVMQSGNLYVYCGNDPVLYVDPNGNEWYHWAIGGAIVAVAAAAVVVTAGGALPALWAVGAVASGATAATTASTIAAGAFIGSSLAFGAEILRADFTSITTINDSADWGTVGEIFTGGLLGSAYGFILSKTNELLNVKKIARKIVNADRVSSAVSKNDIYHRACSFLSETQLSKGTAFYITGHDKVRCILLQVQGEINGVKGIFEFILQPDGTVSHQLFTKIG